MGQGSHRITKPNQTPNAVKLYRRSQTTGTKIRGRKGKSPDRQLRSLNYAKWKRKYDCTDSQEVGLEAATPLKSA